MSVLSPTASARANPIDRPLVSIVSIFHNRESAVASSVGSLLAQDYPNLEIVVVDDGSTDGTLAALKEFDDPRLELRSQGNRGFTVTLRDTVASTRGEFVAIHDAGDVSFPQRVSRQVALARGRPEVGVVGCFVELHDERRPIKGAHRPAVGSDATAQLLKHNLFTHGEVLFRRSAYEQVDGYREFFTYSQDRDLWLRMSLVTAFAVVPETLYRRIQFVEGVATNLDKKLLQSHLAAFAAQCLVMRRRLGYDWVDLYGGAAGVCRRRSPEVARRLWGLSLRALRTGDFEKARWLLHLSETEHRTAVGWSLRTIVEASASSSTLRSALRRAAELRDRTRW